MKFVIIILVFMSACAPNYQSPIDPFPVNAYEAGELCNLPMAVGNVDEICGYIDMRGVYALGIQVAITTAKDNDKINIHFDCTTERLHPDKCVYSDVTKYVAGLPTVRVKNYYFSFLATSVPIPATTCRLRYSIYNSDCGRNTISAHYVKLGVPLPNYLLGQ